MVQVFLTPRQALSSHLRQDLWNYLMMNWLINSVYYYFPGSADEDSGVGGSPGSSSRAAALHNCSMCSKKFSRADILRKHLKTHVNSSCTVCGQIFNDKVALAKHQVEVGQLSLSNFATRLCTVWPWKKVRNQTSDQHSIIQRYRLLLKICDWAKMFK